MFHALLAQAAMTTAPNSNEVHEIWRKVVEQMPYGGLRLMSLMIAAAVVLGLYIAWNQWTLAKNQVKLAQMLADHAKAHQG